MQVRKMHSISTEVLINSFVMQEPYTRDSNYTQSPFRYPGGKYYALKFIVPMLTCVPHDEYREPFVGGGSVFFGKPKVKHNWINDLESQLIATYEAISDAESCRKLCKRVSKEIATKERHSEIKQYKPRTLNDIAFRTYYLNRTSYSGIINVPAWGYEIGYSSPPENWPKFLQGAHKKLQNVQITNFDFEEVILKKSNRSVLLYLDPPYHNADQKRAYTKSFAKEDHERLRDCLIKTEHFFCLSYDDCREVRELYKWANIYERSWFYNTANSTGPRKIGNELLITNYQAIHNEQMSLL